MAGLLTGMAIAAGIVCLQRAWEGAHQNSPFSPSEVGPAKAVLAHALRSAFGGRKRIFVVFGASWCGACSAFTSGLTKEPLAGILEKHYVVVRLAVHENGDGKSHENEGASKLLRAWSKGVDTGIPYYAVLDEGLKVIMDSIVTKYGVSRNVIGFKGEHGDRLVAVVRGTAKGLSKTEVEQLVQFVNNG